MRGARSGRAEGDLNVIYMSEVERALHRCSSIARYVEGGVRFALIVPSVPSGIVPAYFPTRLFISSSTITTALHALALHARMHAYTHQVVAHQAYPRTCVCARRNGHVLMGRPASPSSPSGWMVGGQAMAGRLGLRFVLGR